MTYPQRITHSPGRNIGFRRRVFKLLLKKLRLSLTSLEESNKMSQKTHSQDLVSDSEEEKSLEAYREAAKSDAFLFGDYDGYSAFTEDK